MPIKRKLAGPGGAQFEVVYFPELIAGGANINGRLPPDLGAHALFWYYILAIKGLEEAKKNLVYETELSRTFDVNKARKLLESISFTYGLTPSQVVRYWDAVEAQRRALGYSINAELPAVLKFRYT